MMPYHFTLFTSLYGPYHDDSTDCYVSNAFHSRVDALASRPPFIIGHYQSSKLRTRYNALVKLQQSSKYHSRPRPRHHVSRSHSKSQYSSRPSRNARISIDPAPTPQAHTNQTSSQSSGQGSSSSSGEGSASEYLPHFVRRQPRIQVSSLLSDTYARTYQLEVIQHPQKTAEFRNASLSRLPLTPPLIARLVVRDTSGNAVVPEAELPFLIAHLSLYTDNGQSRLDVGWQSGQGPPILYGNLVSSLDVLEDLQGNMGLFFIFPDVSIRWQGRFQLGISLLRISSPCSTDAEGRVSVADTGTILAETRTRSFEVLPQDQYQAVPHTRLTQSFIRQGARMFSFLPQQ